MGYIISNHLSLEEIQYVVDNNLSIALSKESKEAIRKCRQFLDAKIESAEEPIYGINTGFGSLCNTSIATADLKKLQTNLVTSHACGMGEKVPDEIVRLMLLLKIQGLSYGKSGVQLETVERLIEFFNKGVLPIIYEQGSLGASGDLAPLAHLSLPLLGKGEVRYQNKKFSGQSLKEKFGWDPIELQSKEGLALLNGTQFMSAYLTHIVLKAKHLFRMADYVAALSLEGFDASLKPFSQLLHQVRPHRGQLAVAERIRMLLEGSEMISSTKEYVQDPYSFRCIPQVHGASNDALWYAKGVLNTEINSVTDNPTVFVEEDEIISGGNFHGQPLALVLDFLSIAIAEMGSISERRVYKLVSGTRGLPAFLVSNPGLNSGFMIAQYSAASAVSQNKQLCTPASVDTIDSSNGQEDHVSMGANAATKCLRVLENLEKILSIELFTAAQAFEFRRPKKSSEIIEKLFSSYRKSVPFLKEDVEMYPLIHKSINFLQSYNRKS